MTCTHIFCSSICDFLSDDTNAFFKYPAGVLCVTVVALIIFLLMSESDSFVTGAFMSPADVTAARQKVKNLENTRISTYLSTYN